MHWQDIDNKPRLTIVVKATLVLGSDVRLTPKQLPIFNDDIMTDATVRTTFVREVDAWAKAYQVPSFTRDVKTLIKLKAFLNAKLA